MTDSLRILLRDATRARHEQLDSLMTRFPLDQLSGFCETLRIHVAALDAVAGWQLTDPGQSSAETYPLVPSGRIRALVADLTNLGAHPSKNRLAPPDTSLQLPGNAFLHGAQYVTAGSHLGLAALSRRFRDFQWMRESEFVHWPDGATHWQQTVARLERAHWSAEQVEQARHGAAWMFDRYITVVNTSFLIHEQHHQPES